MKRRMIPVAGFLGSQGNHMVGFANVSKQVALDLYTLNWRDVQEKRQIIEYVVAAGKYIAQHRLQCNNMNCPLTSERGWATRSLFFNTVFLGLPIKPKPEELDERQEVVNYVTELYGPDDAAQVIASCELWGTMEERLVLQDPRFVGFAASYDLTLVKAKAKHESTFIPV